MIGKLFFFTLVCVSFAQGGELEDAIKTGLERAAGMNKNAERRVEASLKEVDFKSQLIRSKKEDFVQKSVNVQDSVRQQLRNVAQAMEQKAKESNKPQSVFRCIKRVEENANNEVETFTNKFKTDMERLEQTKLANIETVSKPLSDKKRELRVRYERAVKQIKDCRNASCVETSVKSFSSWLDLFFADIKRITTQVSTIFTNFQRDGTNYFNNTNRQVSRIRSTANRDLRQCLNTKEAIFEEY